MTHIIIHIHFKTAMGKSTGSPTLVRVLVWLLNILIAGKAVTA